MIMSPTMVALVAASITGWTATGFQMVDGWRRDQRAKQAQLKVQAEAEASANAAAEAAVKAAKLENETDLRRQTDDFAIQQIRAFQATLDAVQQDHTRQVVQLGKRIDDQGETIRLQGSTITDQNQRLLALEDENRGLRNELARLKDTKAGDDQVIEDQRRTIARQDVLIGRLQKDKDRLVKQLDECRKANPVTVESGLAPAAAPSPA